MMQKISMIIKSSSTDLANGFAFILRVIVSFRSAGLVKQHMNRVALNVRTDFRANATFNRMAARQVIGIDFTFA